MFLQGIIKGIRLLDSKKKIIILVASFPLLFFLLIPLFFSAAATTAQSVPAIKTEQMKLYINVATAITKEKSRVSWKDLIAIDAIRYKQDFNKASNSNIRTLAERFIIEKEETRTAVDDDGREYTYIEIVYESKSFNQVLDEMGFSEEEKSRIKTFRNVGLQKMFGENSGSSGGAAASQEEFFERMAPGAIQGYFDFGIYPSVTMAQGIIESGWGASGLTDQANNLFGIKAYGNWDGPYVTMMTTEYYNGIAVQVPAPFRVYDSWEESIIDHGRFLKDNSRYAEHGVFSSTSGYEQCIAIAEAGYATDPEYAMILISYIEDYGLEKYDEMAENGIKPGE